MVPLPFVSRLACTRGSHLPPGLAQSTLVQRGAWGLATGSATRTPVENLTDPRPEALPLLSLSPSWIEFPRSPLNRRFYSPVTKVRHRSAACLPSSFHRFDFSVSAPVTYRLHLESGRELGHSSSTPTLTRGGSRRFSILSSSGHQSSLISSWR